MASKRIFKKNVNEMVYDIVEECFYLQLMDDSKTKQTDALIDETAEFQDDVLSRIYKSKSKKEFSEIFDPANTAWASAMETRWVRNICCSFSTLYRELGCNALK